MHCNDTQSKVKPGFPLEASHVSVVLRLTRIPMLWWHLAFWKAAWSSMLRLLCMSNSLEPLDSAGMQRRQRYAWTDKGTRSCHIDASRLVLYDSCFCKVGEHQAATDDTKVRNVQQRCTSASPGQCQCHGVAWPKEMHTQRLSFASARRNQCHTHVQMNMLPSRDHSSW